MLSNWVKDGDKPALQIKIKLANVSAKDKKFIETLVALFADQDNKLLADRVRTGSFAIQMHPVSGEAHVIDLAIDPPPPDARQTINFFASFNPEEWAKLKSRGGEIFALYKEDPAAATRIVTEILGYEPIPRADHKVFNG